MWIGKFILGLLGLLAGGLLGGLIGMALGHVFDRTAAQALGRITVDDAAVDSRSVFFEATFALLGRMAKADGQVSADEIHAAEHIMGRLGIEGELRQEAIAAFERGKQDGFDVDEIMRRFRSAYARRPDAVLHFLEMQLQMALADGVLHAAEMELLAQVAAHLGIPRRVLEQIIARLQAEHDFEQPGTAGGGSGRLQQAYEVLGVSEDVSDAELKKAYRRLMNRHHPDKLMSQGVPEETLKLATEHAQKIQAAYELVKKHRGL